MADVRALLKAKRQEARIAHPFASYTPSDQLKCLVCGTLIKHASAWEGHLGSKFHRTNTTRLKEARTRGIPEITEEKSLGKRKAEMDESDKQTDKKRRMGHGRSTPVHELPNDFFSDPSHVPVIPEFPSDESNDEVNDINLAETITPSTSVLDLEYDLFQRGFLKDRPQTYDWATISAGPVPASSHIPGFPASTAVLAQNEDEKDTRDYEERELIMDR